MFLWSVARAKPENVARAWQMTSQFSGSNFSVGSFSNISFVEIQRFALLSQVADHVPPSRVKLRLIRQQKVTLQQGFSAILPIETSMRV